MAPTTYAEVLARNIRAARSRLDLDQANAVARMQALGYDTWHRQTMGKVERGERRVTAEEIFALAYVLEVSIAELMAPRDQDKTVDLPSGEAIEAVSVYRSAFGQNDVAIRWDADKPVFSKAPAEIRSQVWPRMDAWERGGG